MGKNTVHTTIYIYIKTRSDFPHPFQSRSFSKRLRRYGPIILCKTDPDPVWMVSVSVWPNRHLAVWNQAGGVRDSCQARFVAERNQPATSQFQSHFQTQIWLTVPGFGQGFGPEPSQCTRIIRPAYGQCFPADPDRMPLIGSGMFTGYVSAGTRPDAAGSSFYVAPAISLTTKHRC